MRELDLDAFLVMPIRMDDEIIGAFEIGFGAVRRPFAQSEVLLLDEFAARAAFAITNAKAYDRERYVADAFQRAALPASLPDGDGVELRDWYYQPGNAEATVGGDWYDAFRLPGGEFVLSIGDVGGRGLAAAVLMSSVRQVIRGVALVKPDPLAMLEAANHVVQASEGIRFVTGFVGVIAPSGFEMTYACAGHLPPLLRRPDGTLEELRAPGLPLGYRELASSESRALQLVRGSALVLYTDGLIEFARDVIGGEATLREAVASEVWIGAERPARALCNAVVRGAATPDDVAILTAVLR